MVDYGKAKYKLIIIIIIIVIIIHYNEVYINVQSHMIMTMSTEL